MVAVPAVRPVTNPVAVSTVATAELPLHVPPVVVSSNITGLLVQIAILSPIIAVGAGSMVTIVLTLQPIPKE